MAPAVYNAVANATGIRIFDMPMTPEKVLKALAHRDRNLDDEGGARPPGAAESDP